MPSLCSATTSQNTSSNHARVQRKLQAAISAYRQPCDWSNRCLTMRPTAMGEVGWPPNFRLESRFGDVGDAETNCAEMNRSYEDQQPFDWSPPTCSRKMLRVCHKRCVDGQLRHQRCNTIRLKEKTRHALFGGWRASTMHEAIHAGCCARRIFQLCRIKHGRWKIGHTSRRGSLRQRSIHAETSDDWCRWIGSAAGGKRWKTFRGWYYIQRDMKLVITLLKISLL